MQKVINVKCFRGSEPSTRELSNYLEQGWRIVSQTPVLDAFTSCQGGGASYTTYIIYIIEK